MAPSLSSTTPPMAPTDFDYSEDFYDDSYFGKTYVPLSNLPTPPPSRSDGTSREQSPEPDFGQTFDSPLLGPAIHLCNMIPSAVSVLDPSNILVHSILLRANLPFTTIALAVTILDSLNSRFGASWRRSIPLSPNTTELSQSHVHTIRPEVVILASLIISDKFLNDIETTTMHYSEAWSQELWTCEQINMTQKCILENLGWRLLPLWTDELTQDALEDMQRAGINARRLSKRSGFGSDRTIWTSEMPITPAETPLLENVPGTKNLSAETKKAFSNAASDLGLGISLRDQFPVYTEPISP